MLSFKGFISYLRESKKPNGTYIAAELSDSSKKQLSKFVDKLNIQNKSDPSTYHSTIIYSKTPVDASDYNFNQEISGKIVEWKIFGKDTNCLVGIIDSDQLAKYHDDLVNNYGASHDFDEYHPHLTISYAYGDNPVPTEIPKFTLYFDHIKIEPIKEDWQAKIKQEKK